MRQGMWSGLAAAAIGVTVAAAPAWSAEQACGTGKLWIPEGSRVEAGEDRSLRIFAPAGFVYVGEPAPGWETAAALAELSKKEDDVKCSCTCTSSSGSCSPSVLNGNCSCTASGGCTACSLTVGTARMEYGGGGFVQPGVGVRFAGKDERLPPIFPGMLSHPELRRGVADFLRRLYGDAPRPAPIDDGGAFQAPAGHRLVALNVYGRAGFVVAPEAAVRSLARKEGGGGSCSCTSGTCTYDSQWTPEGRIYYCNAAECRGTCTLTVS